LKNAYLCESRADNYGELGEDDTRFSTFSEGGKLELIKT
jgi:hypothetical protein